MYRYTFAFSILFPLFLFLLTALSVFFSNYFINDLYYSSLSELYDVLNQFLNARVHNVYLSSLLSQWLLIYHDSLFVSINFLYYFLYYLFPMKIKRHKVCSVHPESCIRARSLCTTGGELTTSRQGRSSDWKTIRSGVQSVCATRSSVSAYSTWCSTPTEPSSSTSSPFSFKPFSASLYCYSHPFFIRRGAIGRTATSSALTATRSVLISLSFYACIILQSTFACNMFIHSVLSIPEKIVSFHPSSKTSPLPKKRREESKTNEKIS